MATATAQLKNYRQAPRKVRLVADLVRGKTAEHALALLATLPKAASLPMMKLLKSAIANSGEQAQNLIISNIAVNGGIVFKRSMPRARGRASQILKRTSHITLAVSKKTPTPRKTSGQEK
ncbi:MAG: 50S ribosomal protein L22 [Patescibacteria group bacterium]|nr:50S ribosomal protein L22 [Patescibacteria group bacterium]